MNKQLKERIKKRVQQTNKPYEYKIIGVTGYGYDMATSAKLTYEALTAYAEKVGAEINLLENEYKNIFEKYEHYNRKSSRNKEQSKGYLLVEITDPLSRLIDELLNEDITAQ